MLIDENGNDKTGDEDQGRQFANGAIVPLNDNFDLPQADDQDSTWQPDYTRQGSGLDKSLTLLTLDDQLALPQYNPDASPDDPYSTDNLNNSVAIPCVTIQHSRNIRLWKTRNKNPDDLIQDAPGTEGPWAPLYGMPGRTWHLLDPHDYADFASLSAQSTPGDTGPKAHLYIECLPDPENLQPGQDKTERRFVQVDVGNVDSSQSYYSRRVYIHCVSDKNEGFHSGEPSVAAGGPASVDLTSGALKCVWPVARSGSAIVPDIVCMYNSRDNLGGEINRRLRPPTVYGNDLQPNANYNGIEDVYDGAIGRHFMLNVETRLIRGSVDIVLIGMDGTRVRFHPAAPLDPANPDESQALWTCAPVKKDQSGYRVKGEYAGCTIRIVKKTVFSTDRYYYLLIRPSENKQYLFEQDTGKLLEIRDGYNNCASFEYEEYGGTRGRLKCISDNRGLFLKFNGGNHESMTVTQPDGDSATVSRTGIVGDLGNFPFALNDDDDQMTTFGNATGAQYSVDQDYGIVNFITRQTDSREMSFDFDFTNSGAVVHNYNTDGDPVRDTTYAYDPATATWLTQKYDTGSETITLSQAANPSGQILTRSNQYGGVSSHTYDGATGLVTGSTDPDGNSVSSAYQNIPNTSRADPVNGPNYLVQLVFPQTLTDGNGATTAYGYDSDTGFLLTVADSVGTLTNDSFDDFGLPLQSHGPRSGYVKINTYDSLGHILSTEEIGDTVETTTHYLADVFGQVTQTTLPDGRTMKYHYDTQGRLNLTEGPLLADNEQDGTSGNGGSYGTFYDMEGRWLKRCDANGLSVSRDVDEIGRVNSITDKANAVTTFTGFDALGMPSTTELPPAGDGDTPPQLQHIYDLVGREITCTLPPGADGSARTVTTAYSDSAQTASIVDAMGNTTTQTLSASGRMDSVAMPIADGTQYSYNGNDATVGRQDAGMGKATTAFNQHGVPMLTGIDGVQLGTSYVRDEGDDHARQITRLGIPTGQPGDALGRVAQVNVAGTAVAKYDFDPARPWVVNKVTDAEGGRETTINKVDAYYRKTAWDSTISTPVELGTSLDVSGTAAYLNTGELLWTTDGAGNKITNIYDYAYRYLGTLDQDGLGEIKSLSASGFVTSTTDERGKVTRYIYEAGTQFLAAVVYPDGKGVSYRHDLNGNVLAETHANQIAEDGSVPNFQGGGDPNQAPLTYQFQYDSLNRRISSTDPLGNMTTYTYYAGGLLESQTDPDGRSVHNDYDSSGRITRSVRFPGGLATSYTYAPNGKIAAVSYPDGRSTVNTYDARGRKTSAATTGEGSTLYDYDGNGDMDFMSDPMGNVTNYVYDNAHRVVEIDRPDGTYIQKAYDNAGYLVSEVDPNGTFFTYHNTPNGRRDVMSANGLVLNNYTYDGNTPTSDGPMQWSLDDAGRVSSVSGAGANCTYSYAQPMGLMTQKTYGGTTLNYSYDAASRLASMTDGTNSIAYTAYTPGGMPLSAQYSSGMQKTLAYDGLWNVSSCKYANVGGATLNEFRASYDTFGHRQSLKVFPTGEQSNYQYDSAFRLSREQRTVPVPGLPSKYTDTSYQYDLVGNRLQRIVAGQGTDTYTYNDMYQLTDIAHLDGSATTFEYDNNGNQTSKSHTPVSISISYLNNTGLTQQCTLNLDGADKGTISFLPTPTGEYSSVSVESTTDNLMLGIGNNDMTVNGDTDGISIGGISIVSANGVKSYPVSGATLGGVLTPGQPLAGFGTATGQFIYFPNLPWSGIQSGDYANSFDVLNRLTSANRKQSNTQNSLGSATFGYYGNAGWQVQTQTVNSPTGAAEQRTFGYGYGGELLSETIPNIGANNTTVTRSYVNAGVDHVMWALDNSGVQGSALSHFYLHDLNGSVFALTDAHNNPQERQRFDAFGNTQITGAAYEAVQPSSNLGNRIGYMGRTNIAEVGLQFFRNRFSDPTIGRFISSDPLGMVNGPNTYAFCGGDPTNRSDPMGTDWKWAVSNKTNAGGWVQVDGTPVIPVPTRMGRFEGETVIGYRYHVENSITKDKYVGSADDFKERLMDDDHKLHKLLTDEKLNKNTTVEVEDITADLNVTASNRETPLSARNEAKRAVEQEWIDEKGTLKSEGGRNTIRAASEENAVTFAERHNAEASGNVRTVFKGGKWIAAVPYLQAIEMTLSAINGDMGEAHIWGNYYATPRGIDYKQQVFTIFEISAGGGRTQSVIIVRDKNGLPWEIDPASKMGRPITEREYDTWDLRNRSLQTPGNLHRYYEPSEGKYYWGKYQNGELEQVGHSEEDV